jgi:flavin-dependent dehydrogenase
MSETKFDIIVVGAGPTGLASAYFNGIKGRSVLVLEKDSKPGMHPRGETLHDDPILDELMGPGVMKSLELNLTADRLYHSPNDEKLAPRIAKTPSIVFEWDKFIEIIYDRVKGLKKVEFRFNTEVLGPIYSDELGSCIGVFSKNERIYAHTVIGADGHKSNIGRSLGVLYDTDLNFPMIKCLADDYTDEKRGFEYYFYAENQFEEFPNYPPGVAIIFPRDGKHVELGTMLMTNVSKTALKNSDISDTDLIKFWQFLKKSLPGYSNRIKDVKMLFEEPTRIPNARLIGPPMIRPGIFLLGDSAGFVEASGGSGLVSGIKASKIVADIIDEQKNTAWTKSSLQDANGIFVKSKIYKHIKIVYKLVGVFMRFLFGKLKTVEKINKKWKYVELGYKLM